MVYVKDQLDYLQFFDYLHQSDNWRFFADIFFDFN